MNARLAPFLRKACRTILLGLLASAASACNAVNYGPVMSFDRSGKSPELYRAASKSCRYEIERLEFRTQRIDHGHRLFIACMENKGFAYEGVRAVWIDRPCPEGTPNRKPDGTCRERRPYQGPAF